MFVYLILSDKSTLVATVELIIPDLKPKPSYTVGRVNVSRFDIDLYSEKMICVGQVITFIRSMHRHEMFSCVVQTLCGLHLG